MSYAKIDSLEQRIWGGAKSFFSAPGHICPSALPNEQFEGEMLPMIRDSLLMVLFKGQHASQTNCLRIGCFLAHFAQLFSYCGRPETCGEQEMMSRLRKRVKINVSMFSGGDE
jgi:hypothetical protein